MMSTLFLDFLLKLVYRGHFLFWLNVEILFTIHDLMKSHQKLIKVIKVFLHPKDEQKLDYVDELNNYKPNYKVSRGRWYLKISKNMPNRINSCPTELLLISICMQKYNTLSQ